MSTYFSNGTEGAAWQADWCDRCEADHDEMHTTLTGPGCEIMSRSFLDEPIPEWIDNRASEGFTFPPAIVCIDFRRCACDRGPDDPPGEPRPVPVDPDQTVLFDANVLAPGVPRAVFLDAFPELVSREVE